MAPVDEWDELARALGEKDLLTVQLRRKEFQLGAACQALRAARECVALLSFKLDAGEPHNPTSRRTVAEVMRQSEEALGAR